MINEQQLRKIVRKTIIDESLKNISMYPIEKTKSWQEMVEKLKNEYDVDKIQITKEGKVFLKRKNHKPLLIFFHQPRYFNSSSENLASTFSDHILNNMNHNRFEPKDKQVKKLPSNASIEDKIEMIDTIHTAIEKKLKSGYKHSIFDKYGDYWQTLYNDIKNTSEWIEYTKNNNLSADMEFADFYA